MPAELALFLTLAFVAWLFWRDIRAKRNITGALWLPVIWMLFIGSRSPTQWLHILHFPISLGTADEGNPLDALIYFSLIVSGMLVLNRRQINLSEVIRDNKWLVLFLVYCFIAISWSDFPLSAFKRWIKAIGHPVMVLVLFSEPDFDEALSRLIKRAAYVLVPLSILLIKYYPVIGRGFSDWGGSINRGVALDKNGLGADCMVLGLFLLWHFLRTRSLPHDLFRRNELRLVAILGVMIAWLFSKAHSATSLLCFLLGAASIIILRQRWVNKRFVGIYIILAVVSFVFADAAFGILDHIVGATGHGATLEGRRQLWDDLLALHTNPVIGVGFESFWLGEWVEKLTEGRGWIPTEAHNGYLEVYLNLGFVGLSLLICLLIATFHKVRAYLLTNLDWGSLRFGVLVAIVFNNWTEAKFKGLSVVWFAFYMIAIDYWRPHYEVTEDTNESVEGVELAYTSEPVPRRHE